MTIRRSTRQRILDVASELFYLEGIRSVGVDTIVEKSGVAKTTLYRHFATKDDLIAAYLEEQNRIHWQLFHKTIAQHKGSPKKQLLALIDAIIELLQDQDYRRGCVFLNALAEFSDKNHPAHQISLKYNQALQVELSRLIQQAETNNENLTNQLLLLINGAISSIPVYGFAGPASQLKTLATHLVDLYFDDSSELATP